MPTCPGVGPPSGNGHAPKREQPRTAGDLHMLPPCCAPGMDMARRIGLHEWAAQMGMPSARAGRWTWSQSVHSPDRRMDMSPRIGPQEWACPARTQGPPRHVRGLDPRRQASSGPVKPIRRSAPPRSRPPNDGGRSDVGGPAPRNGRGNRSPAGYCCSGILSHL